MNKEVDNSEYLNLLTKTLVDRFGPKKVLDIGCGKGKLINIFQKNRVEIYGIDISRPRLSCIDRAFICQANAETIPFKNNIFDLVIAHHSIEHLENPNYFITECKRILKLNGITCVVVPVSPLGLTKLWHFLKFQKDRTHVSMHGSNYWIKKFEEEGFEFIDSLQNIIIKDPPNSFWLGLWLVRQGPIGRSIWFRLATIIRKSFLFKINK